MRSIRAGDTFSRLSLQPRSGTMKLSGSDWRLEFGSFVNKVVTQLISVKDTVATKGDRTVNRDCGSVAGTGAVGSTEQRPGPALAAQNFSLTYTFYGRVCFKKCKLK